MIRVLLEKIREIFESARPRDAAEIAVSNQSAPLLDHLIKLLKWDSPTDYDGWVRTANNVLRRVQNIKSNYNKRRPFAASKYRELLLLWTMEDRGEFEDYMVVLAQEGNPQYGMLPVVRTNDEVYAILVQILEAIAVDLAARSLRNIREYMPGR